MKPRIAPGGKSPDLARPIWSPCVRYSDGCARKWDRRRQAVEALMSTAQHELPVVDGLSKPVGILTWEDILAALPNHGRSAPVASFMRSPVESARLASPA